MLRIFSRKNKIRQNVQEKSHKYIEMISGSRHRELHRTGTLCLKKSINDYTYLSSKVSTKSIEGACHSNA